MPALIFDLDGTLVDTVYAHVFAWQSALAEAGMTMIIVTHEMAFARDVADRVVFMDEGMIVEQGAPDVLLTAPSHERTRSFLRRVIERSENRPETVNGQE